MRLRRQSLIHHFLEESAGKYPDKCALVHAGARVTYETLNVSANSLAHRLIALGLVPGDPVVLLLENTREYVVSYYGILKAGGVVVPLNPQLKPDSLGTLLADVEPRMIVAGPKCRKALQAVDLPVRSVWALLMAGPKDAWTGNALRVIPLEEAIGGEKNAAPSLSLRETDLASIIFTSGSTGKPKGVMLSHLNITANTRSIVRYLELTSRDIQMVVLPFFYVMGKSLLNSHVAVGGTVVLNNTFAYPASVVQQMVDERVTGFSGVPSTYAYLLHRSPLRAYRDKLGSLRYCSQAGGHLARHTKEELLKALPQQTKMFIMYGASEASARLTYVEPGRIREKIDSIGIPIPGVSVKVLDENGQELPRGETGELTANGPNIMLGYWKDRAGTEKVLGKNGYSTGDLGYQDEDGYLYVVGRKDDQLKVGGHRVDPREIEDALIATGLIVEVAVLGVQDAFAGQKLVAIAVLIDPATTDRDILRSCSGMLPRYKLPSTVRFALALPKNGSGKVDRGLCRDLFEKSDFTSVEAPTTAIGLPDLRSV